MMSSFMLGAGEDAHSAGPTNEADAEDENEAYSPSRSFTPPTSDSIPFIGAPTDPPTSVLSTIPSDISLPSNLSEILASIKKRESDGTTLSTTTSSKGINLKEDPIVQNYTSGNSPSDLETTKIESDETSYVPQDDEDSQPPPFNSYSPSSASQSSSSSTLLNTAASSIVPALLSLSTPVVHPLSTKPEGSIRDPRQKQTELPKPASTLSSLSDDDLIKKAMEMEEEEKNALSNPSLQQPLPPGVDNFPTAAVTSPLPPPPVKQSSAQMKALPSGQPLPPGLEDEEYPSYSSSFPPPPPPPPPPQTAPPSHGLQPLGPPPPQNVNFPRHPNPVGYHMPPPPHYNAPPPPPPPSYNMGPPAHVAPTQGGNFNAPFVSAPPLIYGKSSKSSDKPPSMMRNKRKFQDMDNDMGSDKHDQGREPWDKKVPVPVRGHYHPRPNMRRYSNRNHHPQRGFMRPRGRNGPPFRTRWGPQSIEDDNSCYDNIRSEWDSHIKEFEEKRTRERQRERDRERDRPPSSSSSSRMYGRNKNRSSDKGSDDST